MLFVYLYKCALVCVFFRCRSSVILMFYRPTSDVLFSLSFLFNRPMRYLQLTFLLHVLHCFFAASHTATVMDFLFLFVCFCRSLTSNLPNVNLPNVNLQIPKVPNLPVPVAGLSVNLPQMPSFSTPSWMTAIYDSECVFNEFTLDLIQ